MRYSSTPKIFPVFAIIIVGAAFYIRDTYFPDVSLSTAAVITLAVMLATYVVLSGLKGFFYYIKEQHLLSHSLEDIDRMDGHEFERYLACLFKKMGYKVKNVGSKGGDYGGDLLVTKKGKTTVVQAKRWAKNVGVSAIQEAHAARAYYSADNAAVVTNAYFTEQARVLAEKCEVTLRDRKMLAKMAKKFGRKTGKENDASDFKRKETHHKNGRQRSSSDNKKRYNASSEKPQRVYRAGGNKAKPRRGNRVS